MFSARSSKRSPSSPDKPRQVGALASFQDYTVTASRLIVGVAMVVTFGLVLLWFANAPNVATTTKRFWLLFQIEVVVLGMIALVAAIVLTLEQVGLLSAQG